MPKLAKKAKLKRRIKNKSRKRILSPRKVYRIWDPVLDGEDTSDFACSYIDDVYAGRLIVLNGYLEKCFLDHDNNAFTHDYPKNFFV